MRRLATPGEQGPGPSTDTSSGLNNVRSRSRSATSPSGLSRSSGPSTAVHGVGEGVTP
jgi:hypothetical protein